MFFQQHIWTQTHANQNKQNKLNLADNHINLTHAAKSTTASNEKANQTWLTFIYNYYNVLKCHKGTVFSEINLWMDNERKNTHKYRQKPQQ